MDHGGHLHRHLGQALGLVVLCLLVFCACGRSKRHGVEVRKGAIDHWPTWPTGTLFDGVMSFPRYDGFQLHVVKKGNPLALLREDPYFIEITDSNGASVLSWIAHPRCSMVTRNNVLYRTEYEPDSLLGQGNGFVSAYDLRARKELWRTPFPVDPVAANTSGGHWRSAARLDLAKEETHLILTLFELRVRRFRLDLVTGEH